MATTIMTNCTCGKDDPERAILRFIVGNVADSPEVLTPAPPGRR